MLTRFWSKVTEIDGCWVWTGAKQNSKFMPAGYGRFQTGRRVSQAHRVAYELVHAVEIPADLVVDHLCRNTICVNPEHMEIVTQSVNSQRQARPPLSHCKPGGHEMTEANTYLRFWKDGRIRSRACIACVDLRKPRTTQCTSLPPENDEPSTSPPPSMISEIS